MAQKSHRPDSRRLVLKVVLPALMVVVVLETERARRVGRVALVVSVGAGGEAAGAGGGATVLGDTSGPGAGAWALLLAARTRRGGAQGTVLAAQSRGRGRGRGQGRREVTRGQPLGVRDGRRGGNGGGGGGESPQRAVLLDHAAVQALVGPACLLDAVRPCEVVVAAWCRH